MQNYIKYDKNNTVKQSDEEIKSIYREFHDRIQKNITKLYKIINQDKTLRHLMKSSISGITDMLANRKDIQAIYDKLT
jgi:hypothetical protein